MNKIYSIILIASLFIISCEKNNGLTSSGVPIIIPNGNEIYLNQPSDSLFRQNNLPTLEINLPTGALDYINSILHQKYMLKAV